jgi:hypothetical protein
MGYIGTKPSAVPLTSADIADGIITSAKIVDATIANADIANSTINLTTKVTGTLPTTNGGTGLATIGTANQVLAVNSGATALEYQAVSSDYVLLATTNQTSAVSSLSFDGYFSSTYKNYVIFYSYVVPSTGNAELSFRYRVSNSSVTSNYYWVNYGVILLSDSSVNQTVAGTYNSSTTSISQPAKASSNAGVSGYINIADPLNTSTYKQSYGQFLNERNDANYHYFLNFGLHNKNSTSALSGVDFYFTSGNISSGNFKLYGLK